MLKSKTQRLPIVNRDEVIVGVDIGKRLHYARGLFPDGRESRVYSFDNTIAGFQSFLRWIEVLKQEVGCDSAVIGLESTGHYWEPLAFFLDRFDWIRLVQVSPKNVKQAKEVYDNSPLKLDSKDAGVIAMLIRMGKHLRLVLPRGPFAELRGYAKLREQKVTALGVQRNILHSLVDVIFPEYGTIFRKFEGKGSLSILKRYTTPERMLKAGISRLTSTLRKGSNGTLSHERAEQLMEAASRTIGIKEGLESTVVGIRQAIDTIERIQKEIALLEEKLAATLEAVPYADKLLSVPGIGITSVAIILGETGDLCRFGRAKEILKLAGLNLYEISSGQHRGLRHISKHGRSLLRKCLYFAALRTVRTGGAFRHDYLRLTEENHMQKTKAIVAIARKLPGLFLALVRDNVYYRKPVPLELAA